MFIPAVGRTVHYTSYGTPNGEYKPECRAAIITAVKDAEKGLVDLCVLNPEGMFFNRDVQKRGVTVGNQGGTWHEPERVPAEIAPEDVIENPNLFESNDFTSEFVGSYTFNAGTKAQYCNVKNCVAYGTPVVVSEHRHAVNPLASVLSEKQDVHYVDPMSAEARNSKNYEG